MARKHDGREKAMRSPDVGKPAQSGIVHIYHNIDMMYTYIYVIRTSYSYILVKYVHYRAV